MENALHFVGISGSLRKRSFNTYLLHACLPLLPEDTSLEIVSIADIPLYNSDLDLPSVAARPAAVASFRERLAKADGLVIVSPEYNYSIPGHLKNAIDWASRGEDSPLLNKAVGLMGATPTSGGTIRMQLAFQAVFQALNMRSVYMPGIFVNQAPTKFDEKGMLTDDTTKELVRKQLISLKKLVKQLKA